MLLKLTEGAKPISEKQKKELGGALKKIESDYKKILEKYGKLSLKDKAGTYLRLRFIINRSIENGFQTEDSVRIFGGFNEKFRSEVANFDPKKPLNSQLAHIAREQFKLSTVNYSADGKTLGPSTYELQVDLFKVKIKLQEQRIKKEIEKLKLAPAKQKRKALEAVGKSLSAYKSQLPDLTKAKREMATVITNDPLLRSRLPKVKQDSLEWERKEKDVWKGLDAISAAEHSAFVQDAIAPLLYLLFIEPKRTKEMERLKKETEQYLKNLEKKEMEAERQKSTLEMDRIREEQEAVRSFYQSL